MAATADMVPGLPVESLVMDSEKQAKQILAADLKDTNSVEKLLISTI